MAHYPNRGIIDGAFSLVVDGVQHSVFASGTMPLDRATEIGPIRVEVIAAPAPDPALGRSERPGTRGESRL